MTRVENRPNSRDFMRRRLIAAAIVVGLITMCVWLEWRDSRLLDQYATTQPCSGPNWAEFRNSGNECVANSR